MTDASVIIAGAALLVSAIGFFYRVGRDSKNEPPNHKVGLEEQTLNFLELYKYGDELLIKIAEALNK